MYTVPCELECMFLSTMHVQITLNKTYPHPLFFTGRKLRPACIGIEAPDDIGVADVLR